MPPKTVLSPRRRRLRWTAGIVSFVAVAGMCVGVVYYLQHRPKLYRPDEKLNDITSDLSKNLPPEAPRLKFADVTEAAGLGGFRSFAGERTSQIPEDMGPGAAWGDFNNDGLEDLFIVSAGGPLGAPDDKLAPCQLYQNLGDGKFRLVQDFPTTRIHGMGAAWGDYDSDGFLDLVVTGYNALLLFHNEQGTGKFVRDANFPNPPGFWSGAAWGDYDRDRRLDLYVCGYVQYVEGKGERDRISKQLGTFVPFTLNPVSYTPGLNLLFHNEGKRAFKEVAGQLGMTNPEGRSLGALWHDFDGDGWLDLYVANDVSDNVFYHNTGGRFEEISHPACVADYRSAMGLAAGDYDRDGDDDLFITHWVGQENALYENLAADLANRARSNQVSAANANSAKRVALKFMDMADSRGLGQIAIPYVGWGTEFVDLDADGWLDLVVANGSTLEEDGPAPKKLKAQEPFVFWNHRGETFFNLAPTLPILRQPHVSRGMAAADFDNDGAMDLLFVHLDSGVQLLRNEMQTGNWLEIRLRSRTAEGAPIGFAEGSTVIAHVGSAQIRRSVTGVSYCSQSSRTLHFGLGLAQVVDRLEVRWLGGETSFFSKLPANSAWEIVEGDAHPKPLRQPASAPRITQGSSVPPAAPDEKEGLVRFWDKHRAAMNAMKIEKDLPKAINLFKDAIELNPRHEDARYYLGQCLAATGKIEEALDQLKELTRINPQSHRGFQQWGLIRALNVKSTDDLRAAEESLEKAHALNPEETGALLLLGEVALLRGDRAKAEQKFIAVCRMNSRASGAFFFRGYLEWKRGEIAAAAESLAATRRALGEDWRPAGSTSEGDVRRKQHRDPSPLSRFWEEWNGTADPAASYLALDRFLASN